MKLTLIGIGTGNPEHLTLQAIRAINCQDLILIPRKGPGKADLAHLRRAICDEVLDNPRTVLAEFDLPVRDENIVNYQERVTKWHDAIASVWQRTIDAHLGAEKVGLLVWGDPSLYDSTLRIAERLAPEPEVEVIAGITSLQALTAAHAMPINAVGEPFLVTTGRQLRDHGWPDGVDRLAVMLDGGCAFQTLAPAGVHIWWGGYVGMPQEIVCEGPLEQVSEEIVSLRAAARARHGWIMDIYILSRAT